MSESTSMPFIINHTPPLHVPELHPVLRVVLARLDQRVERIECPVLNECRGKTTNKKNNEQRLKKERPVKHGLEFGSLELEDHRRYCQVASNFDDQRKVASLAGLLSTEASVATWSTCRRQKTSKCSNT